MSACIKILIPMSNVMYVGNPVVDHFNKVVCKNAGDISDTDYATIARYCKDMFGLPKFISDDEAIEYGLPRAENQMYLNTRTNKFIPVTEKIEGTEFHRYVDIDLVYLRDVYATAPFKENGEIQLQKIWDHPCVFKHKFTISIEIRHIVAIQAEYNGRVCYIQGTNEFSDSFLDNKMIYIGTNLDDVKSSLTFILNPNNEKYEDTYNYLVSAFSFYTEQGANPILKITY